MSREDRASWFGTDRHDEECERMFYETGEVIGFAKQLGRTGSCGCEDRADILEAARAQDIFGAINTQLTKRSGGGNGQ